MGTFTGGFPKFLRKITFERYENKYIGTSYGRDGKTVAMRLILETKIGLTPDEKGFGFYLAYASFNDKGWKGVGVG
jgi:hypothetical protein